MPDDERPHPINAPGRPVLPPADRHYIMRITRNTAPDDQTTLITPGVDVQADLEAIREGRALRTGDMYEINGRQWFLKPTGRSYPVRGPGFIGPVSRGTMHALKSLARYNGINDFSEFEMHRNPGISDEDRMLARNIWEIRESS